MGSILYVNIADRVMDRVEIRIVETEAEGPAVRWAADVAVAEAPRIVTVVTVINFMTTCAEVLIGACRNRMTDLEIITMHIDHVVAQFAHFVSKA